VLRVHLRQAKPGMVLALPVAHPHMPRRALLNADYALSAAALKRLDQLGVSDVFVKYPGLDELRRQVSTTVMSRRAEMGEKLVGLFDRVQHQAVAGVDYNVYLDTLATLVEDMLRSPGAAIFFDALPGGDNPMLERASTAAFLALLMGLRLDSYLVRQRSRLPARYARDVANLGLGAMLMDIALISADRETLLAYHHELDDSDGVFREHTNAGYQLIHGKVEPSAAAIVMHHHQHFDGTGFPQRKALDGRVVALEGEKIHIFARIAAVADAFVTLRFSPIGGRVPVVRAMRRLFEPPAGTWFDPTVMQAFLEVMPPYAPGAMVRLSDGRLAVPLEHSAEDPCRPRVQLMPEGDAFAPIGEDGPKIIDLRLRADLHVVEAEGGVDVSEDNFTPPRRPSAKQRELITMTAAG